MAERPERLTRADFTLLRKVPTRWMDNDVYGHVNNVVYYSYFDTAVNAYLIDSGALDIEKSKIVGLVAETGCVYFAPVAFPDQLDVGIKVTRLGRSSVTYSIAIFREREDLASAQGRFVHVYVERKTGRPVAIPDHVREALSRLVA